MEREIKFVYRKSLKCERAHLNDARTHAVPLVQL